MTATALHDDPDAPSAPPAARAVAVHGIRPGGGGGSRPRPPRRPAPVFVALAVLFFLLPSVMFVSGARARAFENRALAHFPDFQASWKAVDGFGQWFTDHLPGREDAVHWRANVSDRLFDEAPPSDTAPAGGAAAVGGGTATARAGGGGNTPALGEAAARTPKSQRERDFIRLPPAPPEPTAPGTSAVVVGRDGWLYLTAELVKECNPVTPRATVIRGLQRLQSILTASGRTFTLTLAPDKSTVEPEHLPASYPYAACSTRAKADTYARLSAAGLTGYVDAKAMIDRRELLERREYYTRKDTHWNGLAEGLVARELARRIDPALLAHTHTREAIASYTGDLTTLLGAPKSDQMISASITRDGVVVTADSKVPVAGVESSRSTATSTSAPLAPGRTLLIGDSFAGGLAPQLAPFFSELTWIHNGAVRQVPRTVAEQIAASRNVVVVWNERYFADPAYGVLWSSAFLDRLRQMLAAR